MEGVIQFLSAPRLTARCDTKMWVITATCVLSYCNTFQLFLHIFISQMTSGHMDTARAGDQRQDVGIKQVPPHPLRVQRPAVVRRPQTTGAAGPDADASRSLSHPATEQPVLHHSAPRSHPATSTYVQSGADCTRSTAVTNRASPTKH